MLMSGKKIVRRDFLKLFGIGSGGFLLSRFMNPLRSFASPFVQGYITDVLTENSVVEAEVGFYHDGLLIASDSTNELGHYYIDLLSVSPQKYPVIENPTGDIKIYNNNGRLVKNLRGSFQNTALRWDGTNQNGVKVSSGMYFFMLTTNQGERFKGRLDNIEGNLVGYSIDKDYNQNMMRNDNSGLTGIVSKGRKTEDLEIYDFRVEHPDYYLFENPVGVDGNSTIDMPVIPTSFDIDFLHEVACFGQPPEFIPTSAIFRWMTNPKIFFSEDYPAPDQNYQNIVENVILNDLPNFTNGIIVPEIVLESNDANFMVGYLPQSMLPPNAGGMHGEYFDNPNNSNEITRASVSLGDFINGNNSRRSIALHELTQALIHGSDTSLYSNSVFAGYGPSIINYLPQDLGLGKILHSYPAGTNL